jgi:hypothetical protein
LKELAGTTGLEPAASAVTGQRSNQLNYVPNLFSYLYRKPACFVTLFSPKEPAGKTKAAQLSLRVKWIVADRIQIGTGLAKQSVTFDSNRIAIEPAYSGRF